MGVDSLGNPIVTDQQIAGVHDDLSAEGIIKAKISQGELVKMPLYSDMVVSVASGSGSSASFQTGGYEYNEDGSGTMWFLGTGGAAPGFNAYLQGMFYGRAFGIRFLRQTSTPQFDVVIDGVAYPVQVPQPLYNNNAPSATLLDKECCVILVDDLPETYANGQPAVHSFSIQLPAPATGTTSMYVCGYLVERRVGYQEKRRVAVGVEGTLTTSAAVVGNGVTGTITRSVRKIFYYNSDSMQRTVSVQMATAGSAFATVQTIPLAAGTSGVFDPGDYVAVGAIKHFADAASVVYFGAAVGY